MPRIALLALMLAALAWAGAQAPADTFVIYDFGGPVTLDPARAYDSGSGKVIENIYETLFSYDGDSIDTFVPALATDVTVSDDGTTYTFQLRDGVMFHSGNVMTCADAEYAFEYGMVLAHPEGAVSYLMGNQLLGTQTDGSDPEAYQAEVSFAAIDAAAECPDGPEGLTFELNLTRNDPAVLAILAYTSFSVIDSAFAIANGLWDGTEASWTEWIGRDVTQEALHRAASGTGAYQLVEWSDDAVVAQRFDDYWGGAPAVENVVIQYVDEQATRILALQQGDADKIELGDDSGLVQLQGAPGVIADRNPDYADTGVTAMFFTFDLDTSNNEDIGSGQLDGDGIPSDFFADVNVRRGFAHLFDQQDFIDQLYDGQGYTLTMGLPKSFLGYNPDVPIRSLDFEEAERHFRAAFDGELWDTGFEFTALYNAGNTTRQTALEILKSNLEFLNPAFRMNVRSLPWGDFLARTAERKVPIWVLGWGADYADPRNFINTFYSNSGFYSARSAIDLPEMQELIDEANRITDPAERAFLYREIGILHHSLAPIVVLPEEIDYLTVRDNLEGFYFNDMLSGEFLWRDVSK